MLSSPRGKKPHRRGGQLAILMRILAVVVFAGGAYLLFTRTPADAPPPTYVTAPVLISYSYFEKDAVQRDNFDFFLLAGTSYPPSHKRMHWVVVVSGDVCTPCKKLLPLFRDSPAERRDLTSIGIKAVLSNEQYTLIYRTENVGMDVAAHNITFEYMKSKDTLRRYKYFIQLNSSVKGPFYPNYMPPGWHWTHAYLSRLVGKVHAVSSSLVCLPSVDAGGPGPRLESWAFALDEAGLDAAVAQGVFHMRECKLCTGEAGIVVGGEYGLTLGMFRRGYNIGTLMAKYSTSIDWTNPQHWHCNNNVHPSRHGTYDGIAFHPFETVFVKASWHVADAYTRRYAAWTTDLLTGGAGTEGRFDEQMYRYAISPEAQLPNALEEAYRVKLGGKAAATRRGR